MGGLRCQNQLQASPGQGLGEWAHRQGPQGRQAAPSLQLSPAPQAPTSPAGRDSYFTEEIKTTWREPPPAPPLAPAQPPSPSAP